jgi:hypothetical protein
MAHVHHLNLGLQVGKDPSGNPVTAVRQSPLALMRQGFNLSVEVATATAFVQKQPDPVPLKTITLIGHFDTGASQTSIDQKVATHLNLIPTGQATIRTAGGAKGVDTFVIDIAFVNTGLRTIRNLRINSCDLGFNLDRHAQNPNDVTNFGILIGRDIMSLWNVTWHGPTSTVFISD